MDQPTSGQPCSLGREWRADGLLRQASLFPGSAPSQPPLQELCTRCPLRGGGLGTPSGNAFRLRYMFHALTGLVLDQNPARSQDYRDYHDYHLQISTHAEKKKKEKKSKETKRKRPTVALMAISQGSVAGNTTGQHPGQMGKTVAAIVPRQPLLHALIGDRSVGQMMVDPSGSTFRYVTDYYVSTAVP